MLQNIYIEKGAVILKESWIEMFPAVFNITNIMIWYLSSESA